MNLVDLESFVRVADAGSFTAAARQLGVPTSTLTRRVQRLEDALGTPLVARSGRGVVLTRDGRRLHGQASEAIYALDHLDRALDDPSAGPSGLLRLTAPADLGNTAAFARVLAEFRRAHPGVTLDVHLSARTLDLAAEDFDLAIRPSLDGPPAGTGLVARRLGAVHSRFYAAPAYLEAHGEPSVFEDLADHAYIAHTVAHRLRPPRAPTGDALDLTPALQVNDFSAIRHLVVAGMGIGLLPTFAVEDDERTGRLRRVLGAGGPTGGSLWLVWPEARHVAPRVRAFIDFLVSGPPLF